MPFARPDGTPLLVAHRGGSLEAPENTLAGVAHGIACGSAWQEVDVTLTRDGYPVVIHDDTLERTTAGAGAVADTDRATLRGLRAGRPQWTADARARLAAKGIQAPDFGLRYADAGVPDLSEVLRLPGAQLMLELKTTPHPGQLAARVAEAVYDAGMAERVIAGSFDLPTVAALAQAAPQLHRVGIIEDLAMLTPMLALQVDVIAVDLAIAAAVLQRVPAHVAVWPWTVYAEADAHTLAAAGAHGLITDIPQRLAGLYSAAAQPESPWRRGAAMP